ncbi:MAG TPA: hypothetical protein VIR01_17015, partial [Pyrinomonadaceae bacterium]
MLSLQPARTVLFALLCLSTLVVISVSFARQRSSTNPLTGNWAINSPSTDGYVRVSYFNLKQEAGKITGTIRTTQFFYTIKESSGDPQSFTLIASMTDGKSERKVQYEGRLIGDELQLGRRT